MKQEHSFEKLYKAFLQLETMDVALLQLLKVAEMLDVGKGYAQIFDETGTSTAAIGRVKRCFMYGNGGYREILNKMRQEEKSDGI